MALLKSPWLHGLHEGHLEGGLDHYQGKPSWIVFTEGIGHDPKNKSGGDYRQWTENGYWPIVRLNNGYEPEGTIPHRDNYEKFAQRCQNFVSASQGDVWYWVIGNEPNGKWERPHGQPIPPEDYARCYLMCRKAIKKVKPGVVVLLAPVAMWNVDTGDWVAYLKIVLSLVEGECDGICLHTYSHGSDPALITSESKMDAPYQDRIYNFRAYQDLMKVIPQSMRSLPVLITEADQDEPWADRLNTWIQEAYREIDNWNQDQNNQTIQALVMYRWPKIDKWYMVGKGHVIEDFRRAVQMAIQSPEPRDFKVRLPDIDKPTSPPLGKGTVTATVLNVRDKPFVDGSSVVRKVEAGDRVDILAEKDGWYQIGSHEWVSADWVDRGSPQTSGDCWQRALPFILKWEGGWADHPDDPGGATMKGITIGTYTAWRKQKGQPKPTREDLRNISDAEVAQIYYEKYYTASGADKMPWPMCLAHVDLAVNGGVGRAKEALAATGMNFWDYMVWRRDWYRRLDDFPIFGDGWLKRCRDLILTAYQ